MGIFHIFKLYKWYKIVQNITISDRKQFVLINGSDSNLARVAQGVLQGLVFGTLLFLIHIYDLSEPIKFCQVHHFSKSITKLNKYVNLDMKKLN